MKKKQLKKLWKLVRESRDETAINTEKFLMGMEQDNTSYLRLLKFVQKETKK